MCLQVTVCCIKSESGPVSRSNGAAQCAIVRSVRTRTTSHDLDGRSKTPSMLAPSQQKDQKIKQIQKNERKIFWTLAVTSQCRITSTLRFRLRDVSGRTFFVYVTLP
jgi:hypothetical protein